MKVLIRATMLAMLMLSAVAGQALGAGPYDPELLDANIDENKPIGSTVGGVGSPGASADAPGTYSLVGGAGDTDNALFALGPTVGTGVSTLKTAAVFDYEARTTYSIRIRWFLDATHQAEAAFTIFVTDVNEAPVGGGDTYDTVEDTVFDSSVSVLANDADPEGTAIKLGMGPDFPDHGTVYLYDTGAIRYFPHSNYNGTDSFEYTICDPTPLCDVVVVTLNVAPVNDPPVGNDATVPVQEDLEPIYADVFLDDFDVDGDDLTASVKTPPADGTTTAFSLSPDGILNWTIAANYNGPATFTYNLCDPSNACDSVTWTLNVSPVNDAPVVVDDEWDVDEDVDLDVAAPGVLANDSDVDGDPLTVTLVDDVTDGYLTLGADGSVYYDGQRDFAGDMTFTYDACDPSNACSRGTATIHVLPINDGPVSFELPIYINEDETFSIAIAYSAYDPESDPLTYSVIAASAPAHGTITFVGDKVWYTPDANYWGQDYALWQACDDQSRCSVVETTISVISVNDVPVANDDPGASVPEGTTLTTPTPGVLGNDSDVEGSALSATIVTQPEHASSFTLGANGSYTYAPDAGFVGIDSFTYRACDPQHACSTAATVTITVTRVNVAPSARNDAYATDEDTELTVSNADGVLDNDSDPNGDELTAVLDDEPGHGSVDLKSGGGFTYTPDANFNGTDSFSYKASDGDLRSTAKTVTISVRSINDSPTIAVTGGSCTSDTEPRGTVMIRMDDLETAAGSLALSIDRQGQVLPIRSVTASGTGATRTIAVSAAILKQAAAGTITLTVTDAGSKTASVAVQVIVGSAKADTLTGNDGADLIFGLGANDALSGGTGGGLDILCGGQGDDLLRGGDGADVAYGGPGIDTLEGGNGADSLFGGAGNDVLRGEGGDDALRGNGGADSFSGGGGTDAYADFSAPEGDSAVEPAP